MAYCNQVHLLGTASRWFSVEAGIGQLEQVAMRLAFSFWLGGDQ